jgi:hypothetical protein
MVFLLLFGTESSVFEFAIQNIKIKIHRTIILPVVLYGCETWLLIFMEERRLRVFENRELGRLFGSKRVEVIGEWRKVHNEKLNDLYSSPNIIRGIKSRMNEWEGHVAHIGERGGVYRWVNLWEGDHLEDPGIDGRIILKWIFRKWDGGHALN